MQDQRRWQWLKAGELKWRTKSLICAAQEQALRTNAIKNCIDHQDVSLLCRYCKEKAESVTHIVSLCSLLAGNQYRKRHNKRGKKVHWFLCKKFEFECEGKWFSPEPLLENDTCKVLLDFAIETDKEKEHRRPDIVVTDKEKRECKIIDITVPGDQNIKAKELEKNHQIPGLTNTRLQVQKLWDVKATLIPIVVGALGTVSEELETHLKTIEIPIIIGCLQKTALVGTAFNSQISRHFSCHAVVMLYQKKK